MSYCKDREFRNADKLRTCERSQCRARKTNGSIYDMRIVTRPMRAMNPNRWSHPA